MAISSMETNKPDLQRPMLRMGSVAFLVGLVIIVVLICFMLPAKT